ncbi:MAG: hypothetical protein AAFV45_07645 [Pseudomonadota bacterium]
MSTLTTDELKKYGEIASDQIKSEQRWTLAYLALLGISLGVLTWVGLGIIAGGLDSRGIYGLGLAALLAYWPYRSMKIKTLWRGHCNAVRAELKKRESVEMPATPSNGDTNGGAASHGDEHGK